MIQEQTASSTASPTQYFYYILAHVLKLLVVVHVLCSFHHCLLGDGVPLLVGCCSNLDLLTDKQAITWLKTNRQLNKMYVCWLDEIENFHFDAPVGSSKI